MVVHLGRLEEAKHTFYGHPINVIDDSHQILGLDKVQQLRRGDRQTYRDR